MASIHASRNYDLSIPGYGVPSKMALVIQSASLVNMAIRADAKVRNDEEARDREKIRNMSRAL